MENIVLRCDANKNQYRNMETVTVRISENDAIVELGTFVNYKFPSVKTKVEYKLTDISEMNESVVPCTDIVSVDG